MRNKRQTTVLLLLGLLSILTTSWAAEVRVRAQLSETTIYLGDKVQLELRVSGIQDPKSISINLPGIEVSHEGDQRFNNSSISIINGRTTRVEDVGYVARYRLYPQRAGTFLIPALPITHEGQTYHSQPLSLTVKKPDDQHFLLVDVSTDKPAYVLGEPVTVTLELSLRKLKVNGRDLDVEPFFPNQPPHLQIPWFASLGDWKTTELQTFVQPFLNQDRNGFYINDYVDQRSFFGRDRISFTLPRSTTSRTLPTGTFNYFTYRLEKTFHPIRAGRQTISPVLVKATLPTRIDARRRPQATETVVASSKPLTVTIQPVPSANQPDHFNGGVGRFQLSAEAAPLALKVGDPITLTLTVKGDRDSLLETIRPLALHHQSRLTDDFKVSTDPPTVKSEADAKHFTYTLRPRRPDVSAIPEITMSYYNPQQKRFETTHSEPITLLVEGAVALHTSDVIVTEGNDAPKSRLGQQLAEGLLANYTGPEVLVHQKSRLQFTPQLGTLLLLPPLAYLFTLLGLRWTQQRRQNPERQRSKQAARSATTALSDLKIQQDTNDANLCEGIHQALTSYVRDKLALSSVGLTVDDVTKQLQNRQLDPALIEQTKTVFHLCDNARYAPGHLAHEQRKRLISDATTLIQRLEESNQL